MKILCIALAMLIGNAVQAENFGYGGVALGVSWAENTGQNDPDSGRSATYSIDGAIAHALSANELVVLEAATIEDNHRGGMHKNENSQLAGQVGVHYIRDINDNKLGAFLVFSYAPHTHDTDEDYRTLFGGIEGLFSVTPERSIYSQLGYGSDNNNGASSHGFENGWFGRLGGAYTGINNTLLKLEAEVAKTSAYEDSDENGYMRKYSFLGETSINADNSLVLTYGASYGKYIASSDDDQIEEKMLNVGIRYYFGGTTPVKAFNSGLIGLPTIVNRSTVWVTGLD